MIVEEKKEVQIKKMTWIEFDERRKQAKTLIIPTGAVEVYGPHLPMGTDILVAEQISCLVAQKTGALVSPWLEVGNSHPLYSFPGTVYCRPESLKAVYRDICESYIHWGFENLLIISTHKENSFPLNDLLMDLEDEYGVKCALVPWWQFLPSITKDIYETSIPQNHGSESGTSVMMYLLPDMVRMDKRMSVEYKKTDKYPAITKYTPYTDFTDYGTLGDATVATVEKGRITVERAVEQISSFVSDVLEKR